MHFDVDRPTTAGLGQEARREAHCKGRAAHPSVPQRGRGLSQFGREGVGGLAWVCPQPHLLLTTCWCPSRGAEHHHHHHGSCWGRGGKGAVCARRLWEALSPALSYSLRFRGKIPLCEPGESWNKAQPRSSDLNHNQVSERERCRQLCGLSSACSRHRPRRAHPGAAAVGSPRAVPLSGRCPVWPKRLFPGRRGPVEPRRSPPASRSIPPPSPPTARLPNSPALHADYFNHKRVLSPQPNFFHRRRKVKFVQCL